MLHPDMGTGRTRRSPARALEEAVSLADALPRLAVVGAEVVRLPKAQAGMLFGSGKIAELKARLAAGYYDSDEVKNALADRLTGLIRRLDLAVR